MKFKLIIYIFLVLSSFACKDSGNKTLLTATEFSEKISENKEAVVVDVRTPEEFSKGHLPNAINIDINGAEFGSNIDKIAKENPVFVYCLSGGRSATAASQMRSNGFKEVFELDGGIMKWRAANLPETTEASAEVPVSTAGLSPEAYNKLLDSDKLVLVDVYAEWCGPCKQMEPFLEEMKTKNADIVKIVRIDADQNPTVCADLGVEALPTLLLYKNNKVVWSTVGFISKEDLLKEINAKI